VRLLALSLLFSAFCLITPAQNLPDKINGYKLHQADILVTRLPLSSAASEPDAVVSVASPKAAQIGLTGVSFEVSAEFLSKKESGKVDLVTFKDLSVNGLSLYVEEYAHPFEFKNGKPVSIPKPAKVSIRTTSIPRAALNELMNSPKELVVTGTAFVFARFKKFGFTFKRVVPVKIDLKFANPLRSL